MIPDGIYLNLDHQAYIDDPALGSGDLKDILTNPVQWHAANRNATWEELQQSHMTVKERERADADTAAQAFGTALHAMVLEPDTFDQRYMAEPRKPEWPKTKEEIAAALTRLGRAPPKASEKLSEFVAMARRAGLKVADDWEAELEALSAGRTRISPKWYAALTVLRATIQRHSAAGKYVTGGLSEVSVFWTDEFGVRLKCRFDHLKVKLVTDVKTFAWRPGATAVDAFISSVDRFGYDFSAAHYMDCRVNVLPGLVAARRIHECTDAPEPGADLIHTDPDITSGAPSQKDATLLGRIAAYENPEWAWLACATGAYPEAFPVLFPRDLLAFQSARVQLDTAKATHREFRDRFGDGPDAAWINDVGTIVATDYTMSNPRARDRGAVRYDVLGAS